MTQLKHKIVIDDAQAGKRLDKALATLFPNFSRTDLTRMIRDGGVIRADGVALKPAHTLTAGEEFTFELRPTVTCGDMIAQDIPLKIIYEDEAFLVVDKPAGMVVHPAAGNYENTLVNALLAHHPPLKTLARAGLIHRLDKGTSGLLMVAKISAAYINMVAQIQARTVHREYQCLVYGKIISGGRINEAIGRHAQNRKRMAVRPSGRSAITHYRVMEKFKNHTLLRVYLETGRTHQIRVHMEYLSHAVFGDTTYGGRFRPPPAMSDQQCECLREFKRPALHARRLSFSHPLSHETVSFESSMPQDFVRVLEVLRQIE